MLTDKTKYKRLKSEIWVSLFWHLSSNERLVFKSHESLDIGCEQWTCWGILMIPDVT